MRSPFFHRLPAVPSSYSLKLRANIMAKKRAKEKHVREEKFHFVNENIFASEKLIIIFFFLRRVG